MKICVLTHPLHSNYGGLLQAYALQTVLKRMGHDVVTDRNGVISKKRFWSNLGWFVYHFIRKYFTFSKRHNPFQFLFNRFNKHVEIELLRRSELQMQFISEYISTIDFFVNGNPPIEAFVTQFDAIVVGSDQVWRPAYMNVPYYFLDFLKSDKIKRVAYAASFGVDTWDEFSAEVTKRCVEAAKKFQAISVREDSAVRLCKEMLGVDALHLLDPTLLLRANDYIQLFEKDCSFESDNSLMCYVLDRVPLVENVIELAADKYSLNPFVVDLSYDVIPQERYPSVQTWLSYFYKANYIVTDSYHGMIFSIIFNKQFVVIANPQRGISRFKSLLRILDLEDRLIQSHEDLNRDWSYDIDYDVVNSIIEKKRELSYAFINQNLS